MQQYQITKQGGHESGHESGHEAVTKFLTSKMCKG